MIPPDPSVLFSLAQIGVAFAGFSAIVVLFRQRESGRWRAADADRFHGMVLHAMAATSFCLLPSAVGVFTDRPQVVWGVSSALLGVEIAGHILAILWFASTERWSRLVLCLGFVPAAVQFFNLAAVGFDREFPPYLFGVLWHVFQSGVLFVWLIRIPDGDIEGR